MAESAKFKAWHKLETARRMGEMTTLNETVDNLMNPRYIKVEGKKDGRWVPLEECDG